MSHASGVRGGWSVMWTVRTTRTFLALVSIAAVLAALSASSVSASPSNANTYDVTMHCPEAGETFTLAIIDPNSVARHIVGTTDKVILASVVGEANFGGVVVPIDFSPSEQRL